MDINNQIHEIKEIKLEVISKKDILEDLNLKYDEYTLIDSIITEFETIAAKYLKEGKGVQLPLIGSLRKSNVKNNVLKNNSLKDIKNNTSDKKEYKKIVSELFRKEYDKEKTEDKLRNIILKIKRNNKNKYNKLYNEFGESYAKLYLNSILWLKEVPYNEEVQKMYDMLNNLL